MPRRYSVVCDDDLGDAVEALAREYGLTEQEVLRQLVRRGLETTDDGGNDEPSEVLGH
ncbi:CopG family protein [Salinarchaeum sp. Harcht-Bsk1]|uniref:ribbon-helix-helix domain-containing protein n=1 Tax=Salinarchaeum sp. Harcht-Bsk1 TaxID=1333523 RepID=UPI00034242CA|nr:CopG family transcriptional regulator [Salinarchaeum sp. Harcht-Bsk1]AGN02578.1 CopG family protein [Salinarchaeum sp. Harcht-Bsk1]